MSCNTHCRSRRADDRGPSHADSPHLALPCRPGQLGQRQYFRCAGKRPVAGTACEVLGAIPGAHLIGGGRLRYFGFSVYDASLWALPDFKVAQFSQQRFALSLTYLRAFMASDIAQRSLQEIRRMHQVAPDTARVWLTVLQEVLPDVVAGDRITAVHLPGGWRSGIKVAALAASVMRRSVTSSSPFG